LRLFEDINTVVGSNGLQYLNNYFSVFDTFHRLISQLLYDGLQPFFIIRLRLPRTCHNNGYGVHETSSNFGAEDFNREHVDEGIEGFADAIDVGRH
jgi:hypothetical protein